MNIRELLTEPKVKDFQSLLETYKDRLQDDLNFVNLLINKQKTSEIAKGFNSELNASFYEKKPVDKIDKPGFTSDTFKMTLHEDWWINKGNIISTHYGTYQITKVYKRTLWRKFLLLLGYSVPLFEIKQIPIK